VQSGGRAVTQSITPIPVDAKRADWPRLVADRLNRAQNTAVTSAGTAAWGGITGTLSAQTDLQAELDLKANLAGPTFTGTVTLPSTTSIGSVDATEISYLNGVTSAIQTQLDGKFTLAGISGGQQGYGGTAASDDLTLNSTSNATKGRILLGSISGLVFNETLNAISLGTDEQSMTINGTAYVSTLSVHIADGGNNAEFEIHRHSATAGSGATFYGARSRGTEGAETVVSSGDTLLSFAAVGHDGTDYALAARIDFQVDGTPGSNDMPGRIVFKVSADGTQAPVESFRINNDGTITLNAVTLYGDSASGGNLSLYSTNHATKGNVDIAGLITANEASQVVGIGTVGTNTAASLLVSTGFGATTGVNQYGIILNQRSDSTGTSNQYGYYVQMFLDTAAASTLNGVYVADASLTTGATVTVNKGLVVANLTAGTYNYGIQSTLSAGSNKWNLYISGTADNYLAGDTGIGTNSPVATLDVNGGLAMNIVTKTANYTATAADYTILVDATAGPVTITLPAASSSTGLIFYIKLIDSSGNGVTVDGNGSETIDGAATLAWTTQYQSYAFQCNGSAWYTL